VLQLATEEFFVMYSCCCLTGLGLAASVLVLFPSLVSFHPTQAHTPRRNPNQTGWVLDLPPPKG